MKNNYSLSGNEPFLDDSVKKKNNSVNESSSSRINNNKRSEETQKQTTNFSNLLQSNVFSVNATPKTVSHLNMLNSSQTSSNNNNQHLSELAQFLQTAKESKVMQPSERDNLKSMIQYLNQCLQTFGNQTMGQLHGPDMEIQKTVNVVWELLQQHQQDVEFRSQVKERMSQLESDLSMFREQCEKLQQENHIALKRLGAAQNKSSQSDGELRLKVKEVTVQRDDLTKQVRQAQQKVTQIVHDTRKMEAEKNRVKDQFKSKFPPEKSGVAIRNSVDIVNKLEKSGFVGVGGEEPEVARISMKVNQSREKAFNQLSEENLALRNTLALLQNELNDLVLHSKQEYVRKRLNQSGQETEEMNKFFELHFPNIDLVYMKNEIFSLPFDIFGNQIVTIFRENLQIVKLFLSQISSLMYSHNYLKELGKEIGEIEVNYHKLKYKVDLREIIELSSEKIQREEKIRMNPALVKQNVNPKQKIQSGEKDVKKYSYQGNNTNPSTAHNQVNEQKGKLHFRMPSDKQTAEKLKTPQVYDQGSEKKRGSRDDAFSDFSESITSQFSFRELNGGGLEEDAQSESDLVKQFESKEGKSNEIGDEEDQQKLKQWNYVFNSKGNGEK